MQHKNLLSKVKIKIKTRKKRNKKKLLLNKFHNNVKKKWNN